MARASGERLRPSQRAEGQGPTTQTDRPSPTFPPTAQPRIPFQCATGIHGTTLLFLSAFGCSARPPWLTSPYQMEGGAQRPDRQLHSLACGEDADWTGEHIMTTMKAWDAIKKEHAAAHQKVHRDPLVERTWDCDPLLVIDASDGSVAYTGRTNVDVKPNADGTAELVAEGELDGWHPSLVKAKVSTFAYGLGGTRGSRNGLTCSGNDSEGFAFHWYINGAADYHAEMLPLGFDASVLPPENPDEE